MSAPNRGDNDDFDYSGARRLLIAILVMAILFLGIVVISNKSTVAKPPATAKP